MNNANKYETDRDVETARYTKMKDEALASQNAPNYFKACNLLGLERKDIENVFLYDAGQVEKESIYETRNAKVIASNNPQIIYSNDLKRVRAVKLITKQDINRLSYKDLETVFRGTQNLTIPREMMNVMNSGEITAKYFAAAKLKKGIQDLGAAYPRDFLDLIRLMDKKAYETLGSELSKFKKFFSSKPGAQIERLNSLDSVIRNTFVDSFFEQYRLSHIEKDYAARIYETLNGQKS